MRIPTTYIDKFGIIETEIQNDGESLLMDIVGTRFISNHFDDFEIEDKDHIPDRFTLNQYNELNDCQLYCKMPLLIIEDNRELQTILNIDIRLDNPNPKTKMHNSTVAFSIKTKDKEIKTKEYSVFELGLDIIKENLSPNYKLKCCYGCAFGDYNVAGQSFFGSMMCFKNIKEKYLAVKDKGQYIDIMFNSDRAIQETYLCEEFKEREKGTGYRG
jgi:hypothetical protein